MLFRSTAMFNQITNNNTYLFVTRTIVSKDRWNQETRAKNHVRSITSSGSQCLRGGRSTDTFPPILARAASKGAMFLTGRRGGASSSDPLDIEMIDMSAGKGAAGLRTATTGRVEAAAGLPVGLDSSFRLESEGEGA